MSTIDYTPGVDGAPFGNAQTNPQSSFYKPLSALTVAETNLIQKEIKRVIFDAAPKQYNALKLLFEKSAEDRNLDEFEYLETTFNRSPLVAATGVAGGATISFDLTAGSLTHISKDLVVIFPNNVKGIITAIAGATITVSAQSGGALPAVVAGDILSVQSTIMADGMTNFANYERVETITRYNFIQFFLRAARWGRIELQKYKNAGTTNYLTVDTENKMKQLRIDMFNAFFNGERGEFILATGEAAKAMGGIYPTMVAAGSANANPTIAGLKAAFETLAFATNYKAEGGVRFIYAVDEMLYELSKVWKEPGIRYAPSDSIADLNLTEYKLGTMRFVPVVCELFKEISCFPADWRRKLLVIDQETITPIKMAGIPQFEMGATLEKGANGSREGFKDWWVQAQLSLEFNNPLGCFWIDVQ